MSVEEDVELRDLVAQTLELNGCLPKIRAQLRASIFLALDENEEVQKKEPLHNKKIKAQLETRAGRAMFCLVREFLEYFDLDFTISVYEPESYLGSGYQYESRTQIIEDLGISQLKENSNLPLLFQLIEVAQLQNNIIDINLNNIQNDYSVQESTTISEDLNKTPTPLNETENSSTTVNSVRDTKDDSSSIIDCHSFSENDFSPPIVKDAKSEKAKLSPQKSDKLKSKSTLSSLADLPPLQLGKSRNDTVLLPSLYSKEFKANQNLKEIDQTFDVDLDGYEEDFMSDSEMNLNKTYVQDRAANGEGEMNEAADSSLNFN